MNRDRIEAGRLLSAGKRPTERTIEEAVSHGADEADDTTTRALERRKIQWTNGEYCRILWVEGIRIRRYVFVNQLCG
nr:hypothetical protein [Natrinema longum]